MYLFIRYSWVIQVWPDRSLLIMTSSLLFNKFSMSHFWTSGLISLIFSPLADQIPFHLVTIAPVKSHNFPGFSFIIPSSLPSFFHACFIRGNRLFHLSMKTNLGRVLEQIRLSSSQLPWLSCQHARSFSNMTRDPPDCDIFPSWNPIMYPIHYSLCVSNGLYPTINVNNFFEN